jgi:mRNA interferase YafQ
MLKPKLSTKFVRDAKQMEKRGKDSDKLRAMMSRLINEIPLEEKHRGHKLKGEWEGCRDCHIEPDWVLLYYIESETIYFERTGTHSDIFG